MSKNNADYLVGQPIFGKVISLLDLDSLKGIIKRHHSNRYTKQFSTEQHLVTMLYGIISGCNSLREVCLGIVSYGKKIKHVMLKYAVPRSTLSHANQTRKVEVFEAIYKKLYKQFEPVLLDSVKNRDAERKIYAIDSTTISLFKPIYECVGRKSIDGRKKGGVKSHQKLDLDLCVPIEVFHTDAKTHDSVVFSHKDLFKKGEINVFDRAYVDYEKYDELTQQGVYFVTRLKDNAQEIFLKENQIPEGADPNIIKDAQIQLKYKKDQQEHQVELRLVTYFDEVHKRFFYFLTNMFNDSAETICAIYKKRWHIELFFKRLKQNFPLSYFYGDNKNAIQIQIWCCLIANLLLQVLVKKLHRKWSFSNFVSLVRKHLFSYVSFDFFFNSPEKYMKEWAKEQLKPPEDTKQELLFEYE